VDASSASAAAAAPARCRSPPLPDIDGRDRASPLAVTEYVNDIYRYYRRVEPRFRVAADYMGKQVIRLEDAYGTSPCNPAAAPRTWLQLRTPGSKRDDPFRLGAHVLVASQLTRPLDG
jgi:hypothetical protein